MELDRREIPIADFLAEAWGLLGEIEAEATAPSGSPASRAALAVLLHRLKGSAALYGLPAVSRLATFLESRVARPDGGREALAAGAAWLRATFEAVEAEGPAGEADLGGLAERFPELLALGDRTEESIGLRLLRFAGRDMEVLADFLPEAEEYVEGIAAALAPVPDGAEEPDADGVLRRVHTIKGTALMVGCEPMGRLADAMESALQAARAPDGAVGAELHAALDEGNGILRRMLDVLGGGSSEGLDDALCRSLARLGALAPGAPPVAPTQRSAPEPAPPQAGPRPVIRVGVERLDRLVGQVGDLGIARSRLDRRLEELETTEELLGTVRRRMLATVQEFQEKYLDSRPAQRPEARSNTHEGGLAEGSNQVELDRYDDFNLLARRVGEVENDLREVEAEVDRLTRQLRRDVLELGELARGLRQGVTRLRLVPVDRLLARFERLASGLARDEGKEVRLEVDGRGVELDTAVAQGIAEPLLHLARNAVSHGLEAPEERRAVGKPERGMLALRAYPQGRFIHLEVEDDGRGMDPETLTRRAVELGLLSPERGAALDRREALDLIFQPGFSTRSEVTPGAGRGVGMDAVRAAVARLHGGIQVETEAGMGTRITLRVPLTQVVSEALWVGAAGRGFLLPTLAVRSLFLVEGKAVTAPQGGFREVPFEDGELPLVGLARALGLPDSPAGGPLAVVVIQVLDRVFGLVVDELLGIREVMVQGLGELLAPLEHLAGAAVSGDGDVLLLLDPLAFVPGGRLARRGPVAAVAPAPVARRTAVLLVDDSLSVRKVLARRLGRLGFEVTTAQDGEEALEHLREEHFAVLVTDLEMPRMNGYELIETVRRRPATRDLPVIVITTRAGRAHGEMARRVGADRFLTKPVDHETLAETLRVLAAGRDRGPARGER
jgi:chemosensory pili system protein ChpA (sensor histidine kinase/response regulator)